MRTDTDTTRNLGAILAPSAPPTPAKPSSPGDAPAWRPTLDTWHPSLRVAAEQATLFVAELCADAASIPWHDSGRVLDHAPLRGRWLTYTGEPGCGKTMLARQIHAAAPNTYPNCHYRGIETLGCVVVETQFITHSQFAQRMKDGEYDLPEHLAEPWLLIFDDLGTAHDPSGYIAEGLYRLSNIRLNRWTVWTTNLSRALIAERIDPRIASRLIRAHNAFVPITAPDYATH